MNKIVDCINALDMVCVAACVYIYTYIHTFRKTYVLGVFLARTKTEESRLCVKLQQ